MTPFTIAQLCLFALMMAGGQIFFKKAAMTAPALVNLSGLLALGLNAWFWAAIALYGAATLLCLGGLIATRRRR
jgi:hypothetical protein